MIIGIDEVGRGCWAGPLVAAAVLLDESVKIDGLTDSKKLSSRKRQLLTEEIKQKALAIGIGWVEPELVDQLGLTESVRQAMRAALEQIDYHGAEIIIDGNINYLSDIPGTKAVIKADGSIPAVSAASIIAKVARDEFMHKIAREFPDYSFEKHVGYGTKLHLEALKQFGVTSLHRRSYKPIQAFL